MKDFSSKTLKIAQAPKYSVDVAELEPVSPVKPVGVFHFSKPVQGESWDWESLPSINENQTLIHSPRYSLANSKVRKKATEQ